MAGSHLLQKDNWQSANGFVGKLFFKLAQHCMKFAMHCTMPYFPFLQLIFIYHCISNASLESHPTLYACIILVVGNYHFHFLYSATQNFKTLAIPVDVSWQSVLLEVSW